MKKTYLLACLLLIVPAAQAGGVAVVLDPGETLEGVTVPSGANWTQQLQDGHLIVFVTGPSPGPVIVASDENGTEVIRAAYLPADPPSLAAIDAQITSLIEQIHNVSQQLASVASEGQARDAQQLAQLNTATDQIFSLNATLADALARVQDLQTGTATVSAQIQALSGDLVTHDEAAEPPEQHSNGPVIVLLVLLIAALIARDALAWWINRNQGGAGQELPSGGVAFETDGEE